MNVESSPVALPRIVRANRVESGEIEWQESLQKMSVQQGFPIASNLYNVFPKLA